MGSLAVGEWDWGDNDTLGYSTIYVRIPGSVDPDSGNYATIIAGTSIGYNGGYDYSQQAAAQLSLADITSDSDGTTISSDTGGFTALMISNVMYISSAGGFTEGWYEIISYIDTNSITIDRSAGSSQTGGACNVGGAFSFGGSLDNDFIESCVGGNRIYIGAGTHTLGESVYSSTSGDVDNGIISHVGYNTIRGDIPTEEDRPLIDCGSSYFYGTSGVCHNALNLRFTGSGAYVVYFGNYSRLINCKINNTDTLNDYDALRVDQLTTVIACEIISEGNTYSSAINCYNESSLDGSVTVISCYISGGYYGVNAKFGSVIVNSVIDTCVYGIFADNDQNIKIINNTIYGCTGAGIKGDSILYTQLINNILTENAIDFEINSSSAIGTMTFINNCFNGTIPIQYTLGVGEANELYTKPIGCVVEDPGLADPSNDDFSIDSDDVYVFQQGVDVGYLTSAINYTG